MAIKKLLFIDTNIWLDFYRARNDAFLGLLAQVEEISDQVIVTYQLESEFKRNRQKIILDGMRALKEVPEVSRLAIFSDAKPSTVIARKLKDIGKQLKKLQAKLGRMLENPSMYDPVFQCCQRIFHRDEDPIVLTRNDKMRKLIRGRALRRFLHGLPPRKGSDVAIGDAFNWEWMIHCAKENSAELVIVSRDSDYGVIFGEKTYVNDDLRHEFSERVSKKRKLLLYQKLTDALKHFERPVTQREQQAESEIVTATAQQQVPPVNAVPLSNLMRLKLDYDPASFNAASSALAELFKEEHRQALDSSALNELFKEQRKAFDNPALIELFKEQRKVLERNAEYFRQQEKTK
jgi:hypothetical protein